MAGWKGGDGGQIDVSLGFAFSSFWSEKTTREICKEVREPHTKQGAFVSSTHFVGICDD